MCEILLPISIGEGLDKLSILELKAKYIDNESKKLEVLKEKDAILPILNKYLDQVQFLYKCLYESNKKIWDLCDVMRNKSIPADLYNKMCVDIIDENDCRFRIKNKINNKLNSSLKEQKGYNLTKYIIKNPLNLTEAMLLNGLIRFNSLRFDQIILNYYDKDKDAIESLFSDDKSIVLSQTYQNFEPLTDRFMESSFSNDGYDKVYLDNGFPITIMFDYYYVDRQHENEDILFDKVVGPDKKIYTFLNKLNVNVSNNQDIVTPMDNVIPKDYFKIIEQADEIHTVDDVFFHLVNHSKTKSKKNYVYTDSPDKIINICNVNMNWIIKYI